MNTDMTDEQGERAEGRGGAWTEQRRRSDEGRRPVKRDGEVGGAPEASERQGTSGRASTESVAAMTSANGLAPQSW